MLEVAKIETWLRTQDSRQEQETNSLFIQKWCPRVAHGPDLGSSVSKERTFNPEISVDAVGISVKGFSSTKKIEYKRVDSWSFSPDPLGNELGTAFTGMAWHWTCPAQYEGKGFSNTLSAALSVCHPEKPFIIEATTVKAQLRRDLRSILGKFQIPPTRARVERPERWLLEPLRPGQILPDDEKVEEELKTLDR